MEFTTINIINNKSGNFLPTAFPETQIWNQSLLSCVKVLITYPVAFHRLQNLKMSFWILNKNVLHSFRPENSFDLSNTSNLQLAPVEVIPRESDSETNPGHVQLLPIVHRLPEDDVVLVHGQLVHLPAELRGGVRWLTGAVQLQQVSHLVLLHVDVSADGGRLVREFYKTKIFSK